MLEGLAKHNGPVERPSWALGRPMASGTSSSEPGHNLEAQVAAISDDIAYDNHDIDDGLRAGLLNLDELIGLPIVKRLWDAIAKRHQTSRIEKKQRAWSRDMIGLMVDDVLRRRSTRPGRALKQLRDVRSAGRPLAGFSVRP